MATSNSINSNIPIEISLGGTNSSSMPITYGVVYYDGSSLVTTSTFGSSGDVLKSMGAGVAPEYQSAGSGVITSAFLATLASDKNSVTGDGTAYTVPFDTEVYDLNGDFNSTTGTFVAPATGKYFFSGTATIYRNSADENYYVIISTSNRDYYLIGNSYAAQYVYADAWRYCVAINSQAFSDMDAADTSVLIAQEYGASANANVLATTATYFCGYKLV